MPITAKKVGLLTAALAASFGLNIAAAQGVDRGLQPHEFEMVDHNGVTLSYRESDIHDPNRQGEIKIPEPMIAVGDPASGGLYWRRTRVGRVQSLQNYDWDVSQARSHNLQGSWVWDSNPTGRAYLSVGDWSEVTRPTQGPGGVWMQAAVQRTGGSSLTVGPPTPSTTLIYTRGDGAKLEYSPVGARDLQITKLTKPDGEIVTWHYVTVPAPYTSCSTATGTQICNQVSPVRLQSVTNNLGYMIHLEYERQTASNPAEGRAWVRVKKVTAIDNALNPCAATANTCSDSAGGDWPYLVYGTEAGGTISTVTDRLGNVTRFTYTQDINLEQPAFLTGYSSPASPANDITVSYAPLVVTTDSGSWTYTWGGSNNTTTVSGPNGYSRTLVFSQASWLTGSLPLTDALNGRTTTYEYETDFLSPFQRLKKITGHDGDYGEYFYEQNRRNVTHARMVAKPGSGLPDIHLYAAYPEPNEIACVNPKTCNQPLSITDARGNVTDYTYDAAHGGVLSETAPAPGSGPYASVRPQTRYTYGDNGTGIVRVQSLSSCATSASCAGAASESVISTTYDAKRRPSVVTTRSGDSSVLSTVAMTYTVQGDVATVDGPLSGAADTAYSYYDGMRRPVAVVSPDPDGGGALLYRAVKTTYNGDGNPTRIESGTVATPASWNTLSALQRQDIAYDTYGRKIREDVTDSVTSETFAVTQYSYDNAGRIECVAQRMNTAVYGSLPGACSLSTAGAFGPDRITRTSYTVNNDVSLIQSAYGTALQQDTRTFTYLQPGLAGTVKDANGNLTTYQYDGFNRLKKTLYPHPTSVGTSNTGDYTEVSYDAAGNVVTERRRDGQTFANTYDNLNRLRIIDAPGSQPDVTNDYDNQARLLSSTQPGAAIGWTYDALGRVLTETNSALSTQVSYLYDTAGRRTRLSWPGGFYVDYAYDTAGGLTSIKENGSATLASFTYDQLGRRVGETRDSGAQATLTYDGASRLIDLDQTFPVASANYNHVALAYSPASQLTSRSITNAAYQYTPPPAFTDAYAVNGLNQYTTIAGAAMAHDARGNMTSDGTKTYTYDASNRLLSSSNGASAAYDPTGRLMSVTQGPTTTRFLYDGTRLIAEYDGAGTLQRRYVHGDGIDDPIVWYEGTGTSDKRRLYKDERGSVVAVEDASSVHINRYDEYGVPDPGNQGRFQFTGQAWLGEFGLYHYKARVYNPDIGRFMQTDPIGYEDQMNLYAYVGNDPVNGVDPDGLLGCDETDKKCVDDPASENPPEDAPAGGYPVTETQREADRVVVTAKRHNRVGQEPINFRLPYPKEQYGRIDGTETSPVTGLEERKYTCSDGSSGASNILRSQDFTGAEAALHTHPDWSDPGPGMDDGSIPASLGIANYGISRKGAWVIERTPAGFRARLISGSWGTKRSNVQSVVRGLNEGNGRGSSGKKCTYK